jgi:ABC-type arginine transport system permease subunit
MAKHQSATAANCSAEYSLTIASTLLAIGWFALCRLAVVGIGNCWLSGLSQTAFAVIFTLKPTTWHWIKIAKTFSVKNRQ